MSSVFWGAPEEISTVVHHRHHDQIWGTLGKAQGRASWLKQTPSACCRLPPREDFRWLIGAGSQKRGPSRSAAECGVRNHKLPCEMRAVSSAEGREHPSFLWGALTLSDSQNNFADPQNVLYLLIIILIIIRLVPSSFAEIRPGWSLISYHT